VSKIEETLAALKKHGPITSSDLAELLGRDPSVIRPELSTLRKRGRATKGDGVGDPWEYVVQHGEAPASPKRGRKAAKTAAAAAEAMAPALAHPRIGEHGPHVDVLIAKRDELLAQARTLDAAIAVFIPSAT
jgi:predicted ArsR family transcriptional regulator